MRTPRLSLLNPQWGSDIITRSMGAVHQRARHGSSHEPERLWSEYAAKADSPGGALKSKALDVTSLDVIIKIFE
jgi:hypothetical protein